MTLPRYIQIKRKSYYFVKSIPKHLQQVVHKKYYVVPLGLSIEDTSVIQLDKARLSALEQYDLYIRMVSNSDVDNFSQDELVVLAKDKLRRLQITPGSTSNPEIMSDLLPEIDEIDTNTTEGLITELAYKAISDAQVLSQRTLKTLLDDYLAKNDYDNKPRDKPRVLKRWSIFMAIIGNHQLSSGLIQRIHAALDSYAAQRLQLVSSASVDRELSTIVSILNTGNRMYRLNWSIVRPMLPKHKPKARKVLSQEQQKAVVSYALRTPQDKPYVSCAILLMLQGGMMPSEIARLKPGSISLQSTTPHIVISGDTKTRSRKRVIPIVLHLDFIRQHIEETLDWLNRTTDSNHSRLISKQLIISAGSSGFTGHCLRHSFRNNAIANSADLGKASLIAGWSYAGGLSGQMLNYGSDGLEQSEVLLGLFNENQKIHRHLL